MLKPGYLHVQDEDCRVGHDGTCLLCGVYHGDACPNCGGRGFHRAICFGPYDRKETQS